jgi:hypothetical protein
MNATSKIGLSSLLMLVIGVSLHAFQSTPSKDPFLIWPPPMVGELPYGVAQEELQTLYDRTAAAYVAAKSVNDMDAIHQSIDLPAWKLFDDGKPERRWSEIRSESIGSIPLVAIQFQIDRLEVDPRSNSVIVVAIVQASMRGKSRPVGAMHEFETSETIRESWVKTSAGSWRRRWTMVIVGESIVAIDGHAIGR